MKISTLSLVLGGTLFVCGAVGGLAACSSGGTGELPDMPPSGASTHRPDASVTTSTTGADAGDPSKDDGDDDDATDASARPATSPRDAGADCGKLPFVPRPDTTKGVRCPFRDYDAGANCATGETCCVYRAKSGPGGANRASACLPEGQECEGTDAGTSAYECAATDDCAGQPGTVCCFEGAISVDDKMCSGNNIARGRTSSACRTSCAAGETTVCGVDGGECGAGTACTAFSAKNIYMGGCLSAP